MVNVTPIDYDVAWVTGEFIPRDVQEISEAHHACSPRTNDPKPEKSVSVAPGYRKNNLAFDSDDLEAIGDETHAQVLERFASCAKAILDVGELPLVCGMSRSGAEVVSREGHIKKMLRKGLPIH